MLRYSYSIYSRVAALVTTVAVGGATYLQLSKAEKPQLQTFQVSHQKRGPWQPKPSFVNEKIWMRNNSK